MLILAQVRANIDRPTNITNSEICDLCTLKSKIYDHWGNGARRLDPTVFPIPKEQGHLQSSSVEYDLRVSFF